MPLLGLGVFGEGKNSTVLNLLFATSVVYWLFDRGLHAMKTCLFYQLATCRAFARSTRNFQHQNRVPLVLNFFMIFVILEHTVSFRCYVAAKTIAFPIDLCTFTTQNGGNGGKYYHRCVVKTH